MNNIYSVEFHQRKQNLKEYAINKYGEKIANKPFKCEICKKEFKPIESNSTYSTCFCSMKCHKVRDKRLGL